MENNVVFTFGRFQPVTIGHEKLINHLCKEGKKLKASPIVFISQSYDESRNPLEWSYKKRIFEMAFPGIEVCEDQNIRTPFQALEHLSREYDNVKFICGGDRLKQFETMEDYALAEGAKSFIIESAGARDKGDKTSIASASDARKAALSGDFDKFYALLPKRINKSVGLDIYKKLRKEDLEEDPDWMNKEAEEYRQGTIDGKFIYSGSG